MNQIFVGLDLGTEARSQRHCSSGARAPSMDDLDFAELLHPVSPKNSIRDFLHPSRGTRD
jgi:hypothetical protein